MTYDPANTTKTPEVTDFGHQKWISRLRYTKSFLAKLILGDRELKEYYCALKNRFSEYKGVHERPSFSCVTFSYKRKPIAKVSVAGKTLTVHFPVDPETHAEGKYKLKDTGNVKKYSAFPSKYGIKSKGGLKFALAVADEIIESLSLAKAAIAPTPATPEDFPEDTFENLLERGLIKEVSKPIETAETEGAEEIAEQETAAEETAEVKTEESAETPVIPEPAEEKAATEEPETEVETDQAEETLLGGFIEDTVKTSASLIGRHAEYGELTDSFLGEGGMAFVKKRLIRSVDERWVNAIEDCLPALDVVLRNPSHFIEETEELLPIERTKKVTTQSIKHLCQHTGLISRVENDVVIPSKLLNVFRDESVMTYENKFVNTLLLRLYNFVAERYETAAENGANSVKYEFSFSDGIERDEERGKFSLSLEMITPSDKKERDKFFGSDLWERVKKLNGIINDYTKSEFAAQMGNAVIFPPVVRTNPILKNKNLHQCLELWEFLEGYDDKDGVAVSEEEIPVSEIQKTFAREGLAEQYAVFRDFAIKSGKDVNGEVKSAENPAEEISSVAPAAANAFLFESSDDIAFFVDIALQAESLALNELKEETESVLAEREELLAEEEPFVEEIKSAVDDIPVELPEYEFEEKSSGEDQDELQEKIAVEENGESVIYIKSFFAKLSLANDTLKNYYCEIANALLMKDGVRKRKAFSHVDFARGRKTLARITIVGKSLRVFFALDPSAVDGKYRVTDKSDVKKYAAFPSMLKVRGPLSFKHALGLVAIVCEGLGQSEKTTSERTRDYPRKSFEKLLAMGEIRRKVVSRRDGGVIFGKESRVQPEKETATGFNGDNIVFIRSFAAKLSLADERIKNYYCEIANAFLMRDGVRKRKAFSHVDFARGRKTLARITIVGKSLRVFFALDPSAVDDKYRVTDKSDVKKYAAFPSMLKVRGPLSFKHALELVSIVCEGLGQSEKATLIKPRDYPRKSLEKLLAMGEIRRKVVSRRDGGVIFGKESRVQPEKETATGFNGDNIVFIKSFASKLSLADERIKNYYCEIANAFLSRAGVRERKAFSHADFVKGRRTLARATIIGKTLRVYFAIDPLTVDGKYRVADRSFVKKYAAFPSMLKVRGPLSFKHALELVSIVCAGIDTAENAATRSAEDFPQRSFEEMISSGDIRQKTVSRPEIAEISEKPAEPQQTGESPKPQQAKETPKPQVKPSETTKKEPEYDYSDEVEEYSKHLDKVKGKKVRLNAASPTDIAKAIEKVEMEETAAAEEKIKEREERIEQKRENATKDAGGDPLLMKQEVMEHTAAISAAQAKEEKKEQKPQQPVEVPPDGDVLVSKPVTLEDLAAEEALGREKKPERRGLFARLFGRRNKK